ncbi:MAG: DNA-directed RNA polymerase subunit L [Candidatus Aenigmatarchaeota archaeon]|nr:MAG: DNA-directed RNA polymerase subunit L [Candidatus Aenigmarchaeota archaeon]
MHLKMISKTKNKVKIELGGEGHTFADAMRQELVRDTKKVKNAAYAKTHPEVGVPVLIVETEGDDPIAAVKRAAKNLAERTKEMRMEFEKASKK